MRQVVTTEESRKIFVFISVDARSKRLIRVASKKCLLIGANFGNERASQILRRNSDVHVTRLIHPFLYAKSLSSCVFVYVCVHVSKDDSLTFSANAFS